MKPFALSRCTLAACCIAIAACSQQPELSRLQYTPMVDVVPSRIGKLLSYNLLYSFAGAINDGASPLSVLIDVGGTLYGTTSSGGAHNGGGTVFSITQGGTEKVLYSFGAVSYDGYSPLAGLTDVGGRRTTLFGGKNEYGTVFSITRGGTENVLYSFAEGTDGGNPAAGLIDRS